MLLYGTSADELLMPCILISLSKLLRVGSLHNLLQSIKIFQ